MGQADCRSNFRRWRTSCCLCLRQVWEGCRRNPALPRRNHKPPQGRASAETFDTTFSSAPRLLPGSGQLHAMSSSALPPSAVRGPTASAKREKAGLNNPGAWDQSYNRGPVSLLICVRYVQTHTGVFSFYVVAMTGNLQEWLHSFSGSRRDSHPSNHAESEAGDLECD